MKCPHCKKEIFSIDEENINDNVAAYCCDQCETVLGIGVAVDSI